MMVLKNNRGLTLIELMVGMTVLLIIMAAIVPLFSTSLSLTSAGMIQNNLFQEGRWAVDTMTKELSIIDINKVTNPPATGNSSNTLTFTSFHTNNVVTYTVPNNTFEIYRLTHPLTDMNRGSVKPTDLVFTRNSDEASIDISLTLTQTDSKNVVHKVTIQTTITPLNNGNDN